MRGWNGQAAPRFERIAARTGVLWRATLVLGALLSAAWLALFLGVPLIPAPRPADAAEGAKGGDAPTTLGDAHTEKGAVAEATVGRSIFRSSRQVPDKVVDEVGRYELRGVFTRNGTAKASIRDTKRKKTLIKARGERLDEYEIVEIGPEGVRLRRGNEEVALAR